MKTSITIALLSLTVISLCLARNASWPPHEQPKISLTEAHARALAALEPRHVAYYCLSATVAQTFSQCDWELHFAATNRPEVWVSVGTDQVRVSDQGFEY